jgi:hypothetical protein
MALIGRHLVTAGGISQIGHKDCLTYAKILALSLDKKSWLSLGYILAIQIYHLYGTRATALYVLTPQFGTVVTRKMAGLVQYRSYVLYNRCDDCEHWLVRGRAHV